jgi:hypothetical protein
LSVSTPREETEVEGAGRMNGEANNDLNWRGRNEKSGLFKAEK